MGFATGFTGGVTLTLTLAYLSVRAHQKNREQQAQSLRYQTFALQSLVDPIPEPLPPTRSEAAAAQRAQTIEVAKDRWNYEVESAVRWVQQTDWEEVREGIEDNIGKFWVKVFGESANEAEKAKEELKPVLQRTKARAGEASSSIAASAKGAFDEAKAKSRAAEAAAEDKSRAVERATRQEAAKVEDATKEKAGQAQGAIASALAKGKDMAQGVIEKAKTTVGIAEDKVEAKIDGLTAKPATAVEQALHQRYERPEAKHNRTVAEVLKERYTPMDQRDNTVLRGL